MSCHDAFSLSFKELVVDSVKKITLEVGALWGALPSAWHQVQQAALLPEVLPLH